MKKLYAFAVMLLLAFGANAQNWNFIKANERYHYQHKDDNIPLNTIFADSASLVGTDSILSLNRLFLACDTCDLISEGNHTFLPHYNDQPGFLQRELIYSQVSSTVVLHNPEKNIIKLPNLGIKEWWFNLAKNQKAVLDTIEYTDVFGVKDSVATILINGEAQIKIAKAIGLIQYFDYTLSGLEEADLGSALPTWKDFYDFEVGDVFMYHKFYFYMGNAGGDDYFEKYTIVSKEKTNNNVVYGYDLKTVRAQVSMYIPEELDLTNLELDSKEVFTSSGEWLIDKNNASFVYPNQLKQVYQHEYFTPNFIQRDGQIILNYSDTTSYHKYFDDENKPYEFGLGQLEGSFDLNYEIGKGMTLLDYSSTIETDYQNQIGFVKGVDTIGVVFADDFFLETAINELQLTNIQISPNPSNGQINFDLGDIEQAQVVVYNLQGKEVEQFVAANTAQKDLSHLNNGVYLITIEANGAIKQLKWIKQ